MQPNSADLNGWLYTTNGVETYVSVFWGANDAGTARDGWQYTNAIGPRGIGLVTTNITDSPAGTYHYRFYASNVWPRPGRLWPAVS